MIKDMKSVAVLALSLWTITSLAFAAIRTGCSAAGGDTLAYCTNRTEGDANAVCGTTDCECNPPFTANAAGDACVCNAPYKDNPAGDGCVCGDTYKANSTGDGCVCGDAYKANAADNGCEPKENGARGMTANIGLLCAILTMLSYVNTL